MISYDGSLNPCSALVYLSSTNSFLYSLNQQKLYVLYICFVNFLNISLPTDQKTLLKLLYNFNSLAFRQKLSAPATCISTNLDRPVE